MDKNTILAIANKYKEIAQLLEQAASSETDASALTQEPQSEASQATQPEDQPAAQPDEQPSPNTLIEPAAEPVPVENPALALPYDVTPPEPPVAGAFNGAPGGAWMDKPGRYELRGDMDVLRVAANDVTIDLNQHRVRSIMLWSGVGRIKIYNGSVGSLECHWQTGNHDIDLSHLNGESPESVLKLRGQRIRLTDSKLHAGTYCLWSGDIANQEDILVERCVMHSDGPESTLRIHDCYRAIVRSCSLSNNGKHSMRYHCTARDIAGGERRAHNLALVDSVIHGYGNGLMWANTSGELGIEDVFVLNNQFRARGPDKFNINRNLCYRATIRGNHLVTYGDWNPFQSYEESLPAGWVWENNTSSIR